MSGKATTIDADLMEEIAYEYAKAHPDKRPLTIERRGEKMQLRMPSGRRFEAPLPIPEQRTGGES